MARVKPKPDGYNSITPHLVVKGASEAIDFYKKAFGAKEVMRMALPNKKISHAELQIGDSRIMLADEMPEMMSTKSPLGYGGSPISLYLYVDNVDAVVNQAVKAGATINRPVQDQFYGDRSGIIVDPFGHIWSIATHVKDVSEKELKEFMASASK